MSLHRRKHKMNYYHMLFEYARDAIFVEASDGRIIDVNPAACELLGYLREELLTMNVASLLPPEDNMAISQSLQTEIISENKTFFGYNIHKDGTLIPVEVRVNVFEQYGEQCFWVSVRDVTSRIEMLEKVRRQNKLLTSLQETSVGLLNCLEVQGLLKDLLVRAGELFGTPDGDIFILDEVRKVLEVKVSIGVYTYPVGHTINIGDGVVGKAAERGQPVVVENYSGWSEQIEKSTLEGLQTVVGIPLKSDGKVIGVIGIDFFGPPRHFSEEETEMLSRFAELASITLVNAGLHAAHAEAEKQLRKNNAELQNLNQELEEEIGIRIQAEEALEEKEHELRQSYDKLTATYENLIAAEEELREQYCDLQQANEQVFRQNAVLSTLHDTALGLMSKLDTTRVLTAIASQLTESTGTEDIFVLMLDKEKQLAECIAGQGIFAQDVGATADARAGLFGEVGRRKKTVILEDYQKWDKRRVIVPSHDLIHAVVQAPLIVANEIIGVLGIAISDGNRSFSADEVLLIEQFADIAAIALDNAHNVQELKESKDTIEEIFNAANDVIIVNDADTGKFLAINRRAETLFGYSAAELMESGLAATASPANEEDALRRIRKTISEGPQLFERETVTRDGRRITLEIQTSPAFIQGKVRCLSVMRDITERKQMENEIKQLAEQKRAILTAIPDIIVRHNRRGDFLFYQRPNTTAFSMLPEPPAGKNARDFFPPDYLPKVMVAIEQALLIGQYTYEAKLFTKGESVYVESRYVKINDDEVLVLVRDITEKCRMEERIEYLQEKDLMTGVYNRSFFEAALARMQVFDSRRIGIIICDVDGLKFINDTLGHRQGDELLKRVAGLLSKGIQKPDYVARIGGDEFVVVLFDPTPAMMEELEQHCQRKVEEYNQESPDLPLSLSFGWAVGDNSNIEVVLKTADNNMYRQKMHQKHSIRGSIVQLMMKALEAKDHVTEGHVDRLCSLMEKMGQRLGLSQGDLSDLRLFAKFHDIGKVGIPESILNKPGRLTGDEMTIMRQHCEIGFRIAKTSLDLEPIADWILKHQEYWDGKGYPLGISGEQIPVQCRMLGIVDAFDAMTSDRPYRRAMSREAAIEEIARCAGTQFDPELAGIFIDIVKSSDKQ